MSECFDYHGEVPVNVTDNKGKQSAEKAVVEASIQYFGCSEEGMSVWKETLKYNKRKYSYGKFCGTTNFEVQ